MPDDVLDLDDGIVDQHARDQPQREQRELVEVEAEQIHEPEGRDRRKRNRDRGNGGGAPVAQEEEHHHDSQDRTLDHRRHRAFILLERVFDGVEQRDEGHARVLGLDRGDFFEREIESGDVGRPLGSRHGEIDDFLVAHLADRGAFGKAVAHGGDVGQLDGGTGAELELALAELEGGFAAAQHPDRLACPADLGHSARGIDVGRTQGVVDLAGGHAEGLHPVEIENHLDLAIDPGEAVDLGHSLDTEQTLGDDIVDEVA